MEPSSALRAGRRALEHVRGCQIEADLSWHEGEKQWVLELLLVIEGSGSRFVPQRSRWFVLLTAGYPLGEVDFMPAKEGSIDATFAHQSYNGEGSEDLPWREGRLCLEADVAVLGRAGGSAEPRSASSRLAWLTRRALSWLQLAARDQLRSPGDPFELPALPGRSKLCIGFGDSVGSLEQWERCEVQSGYCTLLRLPGTGQNGCVESFNSPRGDIVAQTRWGTWAREGSKPLPTGLWVRLPETLRLEPWQIPSTWSELYEACRSQEVDLLEQLRPLFSKLRKESRIAKKLQQLRVLLLGFYLPEAVSGPAKRIHWLAVRLPALSTGKGVPKGFRNNERGYWQADKRRLRSNENLQWLPTECWSREELEGRGRASSGLRHARIVMIGAGALGSTLAELLVREGAESLTLIDKDGVEAGNLVRHTLSMEDVGARKAPAVAQRLNRLSLHAAVTAVDASVEALPEVGEAALKEAEIIIDTTGNDDVLRFLQEQSFDEPKLLASYSLGAHGKRIYCFTALAESFPVEDFLEQSRPWLGVDAAGLKEEDLYRGLGCWHPALPVRLDAVWSAASLSLRHLEAALESGEATPSLQVFQREESSLSYTPVTTAGSPLDHA